MLTKRFANKVLQAMYACKYAYIYVSYKEFNLPITYKAVNRMYVGLKAPTVERIITFDTFKGKFTFEMYIV